MNTPCKPENAKAFIDAFQAFDADNPPPAPEIKNVRTKGFSRLGRYGLPCKKMERWKYTDISPALSTSYAIEPVSPETERKGDRPPPPTLTALDFPAQDIDGQLWTLNQAFMDNPRLIEIPEGENASLELVWRGKDPGIFHTPRTIVLVGKNAGLKLTETFEAPGGCWLNPCMQIILAEDARCEHHRLQECDDDAFYTSLTHIETAAGSSYEHFSLSCGARISRNQFHAEMTGEESTCAVNSISLLDGRRTGDTTVNIRHRAENCRSEQNIRNVLGGSSRGVFQGTIQVEKQAQKTDAGQICRSILLSEGAEMDTKPELEIFADDVKCSHGATTGQIDEEAMFYLRSRGVPEKQARHLLISAFVNEMLEKIGDEKAGKLFAGRIEDWLGRSGDDL